MPRKKKQKKPSTQIQVGNQSWQILSQRANQQEKYELVMLLNWLFQDCLYRLSFVFWLIF